MGSSVNYRKTLVRSHHDREKEVVDTSVVEERRGSTFLKCGYLTGGIEGPLKHLKNLNFLGFNSVISKMKEFT